MQGDLFLYSKSLSAFESGDLNSPNVVLLLGGLGDGFMTIPYTEALSQKLEEESVSFVQILMNSSYSAFGYYSLQDDVDNIISLIKHLKEHRGKKRVVLLGHSTGCQDIMWLNSKWESAGISDMVVGGILQAPVSDREYAEVTMESTVAELLKWAESVDPSAIHPTERDPIAAHRLKALYGRCGEDDFFSTDLTLEERRSKLPYSHIPLHVVFSENDEYFPYKERMKPFFKGLLEAWPQIVSIDLLAEADHGISSPFMQEKLFISIMEFIHKNKLFS